MNNRFIYSFQEIKRGGATYIDAIYSALNELEQYLEKKLQEDNSSPKLRMGVFYDTQSIKMNLQAVREIKNIFLYDVLEQSRADDFKPYIFEAAISALTEPVKSNKVTGEVLELLRYVIKEYASVNHCVRLSSVVQPAALDILLSKVLGYSQGQQWPVAFKEMLKRKNLPENLFKRVSGLIDEDVGKHAAWAFDNIFSVLYPNNKYANNEAKELGIARYYHGIQHVSRAAVYVPVVANLYRKHGDQDALMLTPEDIKMLQIGALFHDAAREDEGEDKWDHESAVMLYMYLTRTLGYSKIKSKLIAEAVANKDPSITKGHFEIVEERGQIAWRFNRAKDREEENIYHKIYRKIIHDPDCLDVIRARPSFDAEHLDFYKDIAAKNDLALEEMNELRMEVKSLVEVQGDAYMRTKPEIKKIYENSEAYTRINADINTKKYRILHDLGGRLLSQDELKRISLVDLTPYDKSKGLAEENMNAADREGKVFLRGINEPNAVAGSKSEETRAQLELRKLMREPGIATSSNKADKMEKYGNPNRSISMAGNGSAVFASVGGGIVDPNIRDFHEISDVDANTGRGKKSHLKNEDNRATLEEMTQQRNALNRKQKMGGAATNFDDNRYGYFSHSEALCDLKRFDFIYYSPDPNCSNFFNNFNRINNNGESAHQHSPLLQALYLQSEYAKAYEAAKEKYIATFGKKEGLSKFIERYGENGLLPIFEYSGIHNRWHKVSDLELEEERIVTLWREMCSDYIQRQLSLGWSNDIHTMSVDRIKDLSMYGQRSAHASKKYLPADIHYNDSLKKKINEEIERVRQGLIAEDVAKALKEIEEHDVSPLDGRVFNKIIRDPAALEKIKEKIPLIWHQLVRSDQFFRSYDFYKGLPSDRRIQLDKSTFNYNDACRLFSLCQLVGLIKECDFIRQQVQIYVKSEIDKAVANKEVDVPFVFNIINFINFFQIKMDINQLIELAVDKYIRTFIFPTEENTRIYFREAIHQLAVIDHFGVISGVIKGNMLNAFASANENLIKRVKKSDGNDLFFYLELSAKLHAPLSKDNICLLLLHHKMFYDSLNTEQSKVLIESINRFYPINNSDNLDLLKVLADSLAEIKCHANPTTQERYNKVLGSLNKLLLLGSVNEGKAFSKQQSEVIYSVVDKVSLSFESSALNYLKSRKDAYQSTPRFTPQHCEKLILKDYESILLKALEISSEFHSMGLLSIPSGFSVFISKIVSKMVTDCGDSLADVDASKIKQIVDCHQKLLKNDGCDKTIKKLIDAIEEKTLQHNQTKSTKTLS